ncbi:MAG: SDR family NAD(P)-dependent oxidoreductase [Gaiellales bacterium]
MAIESRVAVVTGSTRGLGECMARRLFAEGAAVLVTGRNEARAREIAAELDASGTRASAAALDVTSRESFRAVLDAAVERWGRIDILVNNAGVTPSTPFAEVTDEEWDAVLQTNLRSVFIGCQLVAPVMRSQGYGRIVNHASLAGQVGGAVAGVHYAASKAGIIVLTKIVARELAAHGVTVNSIAPAAVAGPIMDELPAEVIERLPSMIPVGRLGRADEVAAAVAFLCSEEAGYITGTTLDVNGGLSMR